MSDYADALSRRNQTLPAPDGRDAYGPGAWWLLSCGSMVMAHPGAVYGLANNDPRCLDGIEQDAWAALAAVAWARTCSEREAG